jgi:hypothetical protein
MPTPARHRTPTHRPTSPTTTNCAGRLMAGLQQTAPPQQRHSKDATAHPHQPRTRPEPPHPDPAHSLRHHPAKVKVKFPLRKRIPLATLIVVRLVVVLPPISLRRRWRVVGWADILMDVISEVEITLREGCASTMTGVSQYWFSGHFRRVFWGLMWLFATTLVGKRTSVRSWAEVYVTLTMSCLLSLLCTAQASLLGSTSMSTAVAPVAAGHAPVAAGHSLKACPNVWAHSWPHGWPSCWLQAKPGLRLRPLLAPLRQGRCSGRKREHSQRA